MPSKGHAYARHQIQQSVETGGNVLPSHVAALPEGGGKSQLRLVAEVLRGSLRSLRGRSSVGGRIVNAKKLAVVSVLCAVVALVACRREEHYEPLKLGAAVAAPSQPAP
jgi:hypothetical protein